jgi:coenzyme PQQ precursor peptide PqqA
LLARVIDQPYPLWIAAIDLQPWEDIMAWKKPEVVEIAVGMEINMYACAARK